MAVRRDRIWVAARLQAMRTDVDAALKSASVASSKGVGETSKTFLSQLSDGPNPLFADFKYDSRNVLA